MHDGMSDNLLLHLQISSERPAEVLDAAPRSIQDSQVIAALFQEANKVKSFLRATIGDPIA